MAAAAASSHETWTSSTCTPETARGTHVLRIVGYSQHKGLGVGRFIRSTTFAVGGYHWCIHYYPDGITSSRAPGRRHPALFLQLVSKKAEARARFNFWLVDQATGTSALFHWPWASAGTGTETGTPAAMPFSTMAHASSILRKRPSSPDAWGVSCAKKESSLEASPYLRGDCLVIECDVTVMREPQVNVMVRVPPSDLSGNLAKLLEVGKAADVTFRVGGDELFPAHKIVLATRSPVFDAQFYGPMRQDDDAASQCGSSIAVEDMQPAVFRALLQFIYTDAMPSMEELDAGDRKEMVKHLLVAADRYAVERLKLMCEGILCCSLEAKDAQTTLALAGAHHCHSLRNACAAFLASSNEVGSAVASQEVVLRLNRPRPAFLLDTVSKLKNIFRHKKVEEHISSQKVEEHALVDA